jgi:hypothetical protein
LQQGDRVDFFRGKKIGFPGEYHLFQGTMFKFVEGFEDQSVPFRVGRQIRPVCKPGQGNFSRGTGRPHPGKKGNGGMPVRFLIQCACQIIFPLFPEKLDQWRDKAVGLEFLPTAVFLAVWEETEATIITNRAGFLRQGVPYLVKYVAYPA